MSENEQKTPEGIAAALEAGIPALLSTLLGGVAQVAAGDPVLGIAAQTAVVTALEVGRAAASSLREPIQRAAEVEALGALATHVESIRTNVERLREVSEGRAGTAADAGTIVRLYLSAWTEAADRKMREVIEHAAVNAFDPKRYEEGLTRILMQKLGELEYGDVDVLRQIASTHSEEGTRGTSLKSFHLGRLVDAKLAKASYPDGSGVSATELGRKLLEIIQRGSPSEGDG